MEQMREEVKELSVGELRERLTNEPIVFVDMRDPEAYEAGKIPEAINLNDANLDSFLASADKNKTTIVYCYHGISSVGGAGFLMENGFSKVYSLIGGFQAWQE